MKITSLLDKHKDAGAKLVEFGGWLMPLEYEGLRKEHLALRSSVGIFDVSHMGEIEISGSDAGIFCQFLSSNDMSKVDTGQAQYGLLCNKKGGVVDDVIFYKLSDNSFITCVNAVNTDKDYEWIVKVKEQFGYSCNIQNSSMMYSQIAVQGPRAAALLKDVFGKSISDIKRFRFINLSIGGFEVLVARTGYTGEDGFEIFTPWGKGPVLWEELLNAGAEYGLKPCGLGCRDTLRIEAGYPLYGHEIDEETNPLEVGLSRFVKLDSDDFVGRTEILKRLEAGIKRQLVGFYMLEPGIPRQGYEILSCDTVIGKVTSGTYSPSLDRPIGMCLISAIYDKNNLYIDIRNKKRKIEIVDIPFYKKQ